MNKELATELEPEIPAEEIAAEQPAEETSQVEAEQPKEEKKDPSEKNVPHGAFHEERQKRKAAEQELNQLRQNQAVIADRYNQLWQAVNQQQQPQIPSEDVDPLTNHRVRLAMAERAQQQLAAELQARRQQDAASQQEQAFRAHVSGLEVAFVKEKPDYPQALQFARERRAQELEALGYPPEEIPTRLQNDAMAIAWDALRQGRNPAAAIYAAAEVMGYKRKEVQGQQKIETLQKGTQAAKTLGNGQPAGVPTPEQIADMSDIEFAEFKAKLAKKGQRISDVL